MNYLKFIVQGSPWNFVLFIFRRLVCNMFECLQVQVELMSLCSYLIYSSQVNLLLDFTDFTISVYKLIFRDLVQRSKFKNVHKFRIIKTASLFFAPIKRLITLTRLICIMHQCLLFKWGSYSVVPLVWFLFY